MHKYSILIKCNSTPIAHDSVDLNRHVTVKNYFERASCKWRDAQRAMRNRKFIGYSLVHLNAICWERGSTNLCIKNQMLD